MARTFARIVAIATCVALSLTAEDRQARSGDLDRGPPPVFDGSVRYRGQNRFVFLDGRQPANSYGSVRSLGNVPVGNSDVSRQVGTAYSDGGVAGSSHFFHPSERTSQASTFQVVVDPQNQKQQLFNNIHLNRTQGDTILTYFSNLRHKVPANYQPADTNTRQMRTGDRISQISFDQTEEESLALKRRIEMSTEFFLVPSTSTPSTTTATVHVTKAVNPADHEKIAGIFRNEVWVVPILALSSITMILIASFEVFVLCKAWRTTPSRRHLFLGQMLLLGLFSCAGLASIFAASPSQFTCGLMRFGTGVAYAIVFASLLVKCVFLISLNGGVYLPAPYQGLLLMFAILIQVAIAIQWLLTSPPQVDMITIEQVVYQNRNRLLVTAADISTSHNIPLCRTSYIDMLFSLIYVIFLIIFVTVLAVKSRGIRDNYREATYIGLSVGCSIPIWLIWIISGLVVSERHKDACIAFGLVILSIMVFLIMFMPKGRQLAAMGKEGVYVEDREERFSSLSRAGSGYSPSFFHFKPIKQGINHNTSHKHQHITTLGGGGGGTGGGLYLRPDDGNLYTTLEPTLSSNPNVYFQRGNGVHPGMMY
ncbi:uncharacterized protein LOC143197895 isoform X2 [Rhynchophorus ferrugineus]|uniref:uncharacterized protein LOC143197895 isoform X2 n=1 Tax=Rhynchophorus ferrugineus TaxID=354439 RepID=UPI003FCD8B80